MSPKNQVSELKSQLGLQSSKGSRTQRETAGEDDLDLDLEAEFMGTAATGSSTYRKKTAEERHKETIRKLDKERKEATELRDTYKLVKKQMQFTVFYTRED